jgi:hypothetical protein
MDNPKKDSEKYRAMDDPVFRTISPKGAMKHDLYDALGDIGINLIKLAWKESVKIYKKRKK